MWRYATRAGSACASWVARPGAPNAILMTTSGPDSDPVHHVGLNI